MIPPISVIIVTHNHADYLGPCLMALASEARAVGGEIIVVDNRSDDASARIAAGFGGAQLIVPPVRQGFSANNNLGMARARGRSLLLLNPDTEVRPGALETLIQFMDTHPSVGMCGAQLLFPDGSIQPSARRFPTIGTGIVRRSPLRVFLKQSATNRHHLMLDEQPTDPQPVDWLLGACMCVRRAAVERVGPLDEGYVLYVEDIDWARRMHNGGWGVYYVPQAQIVHHHLAVSDRRLLSRRTLIHTRSMWRYARKFMLPPLPGLRIRGYRSAVWDAAMG